MIGDVVPTLTIESVEPYITMIRLDRPERLNAINYDLVCELHDALDVVAGDEDCKVVILTGAGRGFCAGLDLRDWGSPPAPGEHPHAKVGVDGQAFMANLTVHMRNTPQVIIGAVNGPAFGGGLSLASAMEANGVGELLGAQVAGLAGLPSLSVVLAVTAGVIFLTELTSNTATAATLVPILGALAPGLGFEPLLLAVPAAIAASCAFMLPVATPPNAIVFGSGRVGIAEMSRAGLWLNVIGTVLITALTMEERRQAARPKWSRLISVIAETI